MTRPTLVLGSSSPRRKDLLTTLGLKFTVLKPETPEIPHPGEAPRAYALRNAREKAEWIVAALASQKSSHPEGCLVVTADTIVVLDGQILEKPRDRAHAADMLGRLGGRRHTVISGVGLYEALAPGSRHKLFAVETEVLIKQLTSREIDSYIATGEPLDKAGGYAAQGIGSYMVERIEGSYSNVVGLPVAEVVASLTRDFGFDLWEGSQQGV